MPNLTGVRARPRFSQGLPALKRVLTGIRLPVGVCREGNGRVEGGVPVLTAAHPPRQPALDEDEQPQEAHRHDAEGEHAQGVDGPALLGPRVDTDEAIDDALDAPVVLVGEHTVHPVAERHVDEREDNDEGRQVEQGLRSGSHT